MCITGYGTMENPIHSLWKSKNSFPTSCKQGFPQFHKHSQLYDIPTMPAPTESIFLSISFIKAFFYRSIPALSAKSAFRPISIDCFSSGRLSNAPLYPFSNKGVPFAIRYSLDLCQYFGHKKLKVYADFFNSSSSFCWGVI